jgi:cobalamin biosynthesis Co2+ chelatase CbiK
VAPVTCSTTSTNVFYVSQLENRSRLITNIEKRAKAAFPENEIRWAYTSNIIQKKTVEKRQVH